MLGNSHRKGARELRRALLNTPASAKHTHIRLPTRHNAVACNHLRALAIKRKIHTGKYHGLLQERNGIPESADGLEMSVGFTNPVDSTAVVPERQGRLSTGAEEDGVKHGRAHTLEVVIRQDTLVTTGGLINASGVDCSPARRHHKGKSALGLECSSQRGQCFQLEPIGDDDSDATRVDSGRSRRIVELRKTRCLEAMVLSRGSLWDVCTDHLSDSLREVEVNIGEALGHALVHDRVVAVVKFKSQRILHVKLLVRRERVVEELRVVEVLLEFHAVETLAGSGNRGMVVYVCVVVASLFCVRDSVEAVRPVVYGALVDAVIHCAVTVEVHDRAHGAVDGELFPVNAEAGDLGVLVGEVAALEEGVIGEADAAHDVRGAEGDLFGLREEFVNVAVERKFTDIPDRHDVFGPDFRGVEDVEVGEHVLVLLGYHLDTELPLGVGSVFDCFHEVLAVEVGILAADFEGFVPDE